MKILGLNIGWRDATPPPPPPAPTPAQPPEPGAAGNRSARRRRGRVGPRSRVWDAGETTNLSFDWLTTPTTSDQDLFRKLRPLRARSREQVANNPYARKFMGMLRTNVVGPQGLRLQVRSKSDATNEAIEEAWLQWGKSKACDVEGKRTWRQMQELCLTTMAQDGEFILRKRRGPRWGRWGFALQFLDPELLDIQKNAVLENGHIVRMGVEMDEFRRPVAYWFLDPRERLDGAISYYARDHIRVAAEEIIHGFMHERVGQTRGVPWLATVLIRLRMLGRYEEAALVAARIGASKMGFITTETGDGYKGDDEDADGAVIQDVEPGTFEQLPAGTSVTAYNPDYPHGEFAQFNSALLQGISSGLLVSYPSLSSNLGGVNYSSIRAGLLEERDQWRLVQGLLGSECSDPAYQAWLEMQLLTGTIAVAGTPLSLRDEEEYRYRSTWGGRRWEWVDPQKEIAAAEKAVQNRFKSRSQVIRDMGQDDPADVFAEIAKEEQLLAELGIPPVPATPSKPKVEDPPDEDGEDQDNEDAGEKESE